MRFEDVLPAFRNGKKIRLKSWSTHDYINVQMIEDMGDIDVFSMFVTVDDILGDQWEIILDAKDYQTTPKSAKGEHDNG